jgi:hypothetical protein
MNANNKQQTTKEERYVTTAFFYKLLSDLVKKIKENRS